MYSRYEDGRGLDWLVLSVVPESDLLDALPVQGRHMLALHGGSLLGVLLISWLVAWRLARRSVPPESVSGEAGSGHDGASCVRRFSAISGNVPAGREVRRSGG